MQPPQLLHFTVSQLLPNLPPRASPPSLAWREHKIEAVAYILVEVRDEVVVVAEVKVCLVVVIVVAINIVVNVDHQCDD